MAIPRRKVWDLYKAGLDQRDGGHGTDENRSSGERQGGGRVSGKECRERDQPQTNIEEGP